MTNREKFREVFNKDIYWSRALEPQMLALKSAHIDGIDCMEEWLNAEYKEPIKALEQESKKGYWVFDYISASGHKTYHCSECGCYIQPKHTERLSDYKWCSLCGTKMGVENGNNN